MSKLMVSVSGIRGIVGDGLSSDVIVNYTAAFSKFCPQGKIVVGRDTRKSGKNISNLVINTLNMCGYDVIDIGIATTPTVEMAIKQYEAAGGIAITASHNPNEWNALKLMGANTLFLDEEAGKEIQTILKENDKTMYVSFENLGSTEEKAEEANNFHIKKILDIPYIDKSALRSRGFKVIVDCVNGAGSVILPDLLIDLGCSVTKINCATDQDFPHGAEPIPENLTEISEIMQKEKYDLGIVVDPDSDRLALLDEEGQILGEEYTLALAIDLVLSKVKSDICCNISTSRLIDDLAKKYQVKLHRTKVGEVHVAKKMIATGSLIGGEGNGGVILKEIHPGRDALVGIALILQLMVEKECYLSHIKKEHQNYEIIKDKTSTENISYEEIVREISENEPKETLDFTDGLKINHPDFWIQIRKSNTEPIIRIFVESYTKEDAQRELHNFKQKYGLF